MPLLPSWFYFIVALGAIYRTSSYPRSGNPTLKSACVFITADIAWMVRRQSAATLPSVRLDCHFRHVTVALIVSCSLVAVD